MKSLSRYQVFLLSALQRRSFLRYAGAGIAGAALLALGCKKSEPIEPEGMELSALANLNTQKKQVVVLGVADTAVWNFAYVLQQFEAAFYTQVLATPYVGMTSTDLMYLKDILDHEIVHRETLKAVIGKKAIPSLEIDFHDVDFTNRNSVLANALMWEDNVLNHVGGVMELSMDRQYVRLANKIVSVDARHSAIIRELIDPESFLSPLRLNRYGLEPVDYRTAGFITTLNGYLKNVKLDNTAIERITS